MGRFRVGLRSWRRPGTHSPEEFSLSRAPRPPQPRKVTETPSSQHACAYQACAPGCPPPLPALRALLPLLPACAAARGHGTAPLANALQASAAAAARSSSARINAQNPATPPRGLVGVLNRVHAHRLRTTKARTATVRQPFWPGPLPRRRQQRTHHSPAVRELTRKPRPPHRRAWSGCWTMCAHIAFAPRRRERPPVR